MNAYEEKRAARIERLRDRADRREAEAASAIAKVDRMAGIMNGTPILIGHHSERRHRRDLERMDANMRKSIEASKEAEALRRRADSAEDNPMISTDDPEAVSKLREKLAKLEDMQTRMVAGNKVLRAGGTDEQLAAATGLPVDQVGKLREKDFAGRIGFPGFALTNNSAEIRRCKKRIAELEAKAIAPAKDPEEIGGIRIEESDNRVRIVFPGKPSETVRTRLKSRGFRWSPMAGAWQRYASPGAWYDARECVRFATESDPS